RFDGGLQDIFDLQDRVTAKVVGEIAPRLEQVEIERAKRKQTENLDAYDYFLRALASLHEWTRESNDEALRLFYRAIEFDPGFASAYGLAAMCFHWRKVNGWIVDPAREIAEAERLGRRAVELGPDDAVALSGGGYALVFVAHDLNDGPAFIERALTINPNLAWALFSSGWTKAFLGIPKARSSSSLTRCSFRRWIRMASGREVGSLSLTFSLAATKKRSRGRKQHCGNVPLIRPPFANWRPPVRLPGGFQRHKRPWRACAILTRQGVYPRSRIGFRFADPTISRGCR